jgi:hypothetical protein
MDVSPLYGLNPDQFVAARNQLAKSLRAAGQRQDAAEVARLRKPPAPAWALNQVARQSSDLIDAVLSAGAHLRAAMDAALTGDPSGVRAARTAEREAVNAAVAEALRHLEQIGHSANEAARRRIEATLRAAAIDDPVAERLRQGRLDSDEEASGFGFEVSGALADAASAEPIRTAPDPAAGTPRPARPPKPSDARRRPAPRLTTAGETAPDGARDGEAPSQQAADDESSPDAAAARQAVELRARLVDEADRLAERAEELTRAADDSDALARQARRTADEATAKAREARARAEELRIAGD